MPRGSVMEMQAGWQSRPVFGRDAGKRMRWVLFGRELPRIALLQVMGSAPQLIPSQTTGTRACHSTGVTAQWQKMPGTLAVVPLQQVPAPALSWSYPWSPPTPARCGTCTGLRGGRGRCVCWCPAPPLPTLGMGLQEAAGPIRPGSLGGFCTQACPERSQDIGEKCAGAWIFGRSLEPCTGKCPPRCCAPSRARWELLIQQGGSPRSRNWAAEDDPQHCTEMSPRLSFKAVLPKPSGPLSSVFRWAEVGLEHFVWAPRACEPVHFWEGRDWDTHPRGFACDWCSWEALPQTFPTWLRQPKAFWAVVR